MFSQYGKLIQKKSADHQVFAIDLQNFNKIGVKTHPECVKELDEKRVDDIMIDQENTHYETGSYRLPGSLIVAAVPKKGSVINYNYILLDGRHRYYAAKQLSYQVDFTVEVLRFDNYEEMKDEFYRLNKQKSVSMYKLKND